MRILVTGSRDWPYPEIIWSELYRCLGHPETRSADDRFIVVEGACPSGADKIAHEWAQAQQEEGLWPPVVSERHPADWARYGKDAGPIRNKQMVALGADLCLAFCLSHSRGTVDCYRRAIAAGIPTRIIDLAITEKP